MEEINTKLDKFTEILNKYGYKNDSGEYYIDPLVMSKVVEEELNWNLPFSNITTFVKSTYVNLTEIQINKFLQQKLIEEQPDLNKRNEERRNVNIYSSKTGGILDTKKATEEFSDSLLNLRYTFNSYTLTYFKKYISILKKKSLLLMKLIQKIQDNKVNPFEGNAKYYFRKQLEQYDITINEDGDIYYQDFIRLLTPLIKNLTELKSKAEKANTLETYLTFRMSKDKIYRNGLSEDDVYPTKELQVMSYDADYEEGNIALSDKQRQALADKYNKTFKIVSDLVINMDSVQEEQEKRKVKEK